MEPCERKYAYRFSNSKPYVLPLDEEEARALAKRLFAQEKMNDREKELCKEIYMDLERMNAAR